MWQSIGHEKQVDLFKRCLEQQCLAHAYLLVGPPHVGKMTLARDLAQALNCSEAERPCGKCASCLKIAAGNHADIQVIGLGVSAEGKPLTEISIDQVRDMQHSANLPPFEGKQRVFIIDGAEFLSNEAANRLLKTLEEPVGNVIFLLLTANEKLLLATVVSRCQKLELFPVRVAQIESVLVGRWGIEAEKARLLAWLSHGCLGWAVNASSNSNLLDARNAEIERLLAVIKDSNVERFIQAAKLSALFGQSRNAVYGILDLWLDYWHDLMLVKTGHDDIIINRDQLATMVALARDYELIQIRAYVKSIQLAREQLMLNANAQLVLEVLMLDLPGKEKKRSEATRAA